MTTKLCRWFMPVLLGCVRIGCFLDVSAPCASDRPAIVAETNYDFGELSETTPLAHAFIVKNTGSRALNIKDVQPS